ncbi:hypothetical protein AX16_004288 [Volvariella volvacea WC 439]|nr:hypothetical protein AX16_004288 [Volvariella volvacea WC 439]
MPAELPPELVEVIVNHLRNDRSVLKTCTLVSRAFCLPAQKHLFRDILLSFGDNIAGSTRLTKLLLASQTPLSLVRYLSITEESFKSVVDSQLLLEAMKLLVNLTRIQVQCQSDVVALHGSKFNGDIFSQCCRPKITRLTLIWVPEFPLDGLYLCTSLTHLSLINTAIWALPSPVPAPVTRIQLKSLFLGSFSLPFANTITPVELLRHPMCPFDLRQLESLSFGTEEMDEYEQYLSILGILPSTITSFAVEVPLDFAEEVSAGPLINISSMPNLACLTFSIEEYGVLEISYVPWMVAQLQQFPTENKLRELHLWIAYEDDSPDCVWTSIWTTLDEALAEPMFAALGSVYIKLFLRYRYSDEEKLPETLKLVLPKTAQRKSLLIETSRSKWRGLNEDFPVISG